MPYTIQKEISLYVPESLSLMVHLQLPSVPPARPPAAVHGPDGMCQNVLECPGMSQ